MPNPSSFQTRLSRTPIRRPNLDQFLLPGNRKRASTLTESRLDQIPCRVLDERGPGIAEGGRWSANMVGWGF